MIKFQDRLARFVSARPPISLLAVAVFCLIGSNIAVSAQARQTGSVARLAPSNSSTISPERGSADRGAEQVTPIERRAFELVNSVRVKNGLPELKWDADLYRVARDYSREMARRQFFSHTRPDGATPRDRIREAGLKSFRVVAENIAYNQGYDDPGGFAVERWMASSGHRENILNRQFQDSAIGVFVNAEGCVYLTQLFILR